MNYIELFLIAISLALDAFAVSITLGIKKGGKDISLVLKASITFAFFQAFMPLLGFLIGNTFKTYFESYSGIIAFILLSLIGLNMIRTWHGGCDLEKMNGKRKYSSWSNILILGVATSIDALTVGFSLSLIDFNIFLSAAMIGLVTFFLSFIGVDFGTKLGCRFKNAELIGGFVLIAIGVKILLV
jgi:putative Mn2+ efflux pump MntP